MNEILSYSLFNLGAQDITVGQIILLSLIIVAIFYLYRIILKTYSPQLFKSTEISQKEKSLLAGLVRGFAILCLVLAIVSVFNLDYGYRTEQGINFSVIAIVRLLLFLQFARFLYWFLTNIIIHGYYARRDLDTGESRHSELADSEISAFRTVRNIFFLLVAIYALRNFNFDPTIYSREIEGDIVSFNVSNILRAVLIFLFARLIIWVITQILLYSLYAKNKILVGSQYAINQLIKYVVYVFAIIFALDVFGINMNILLGGAAALLVGIGLGLQQTFNDFVSGIVILFERSVSVGDVLEIEGTVGRVKEIGLRASTLETRGNIRLVVPNHKLVNEKVVNWNHENDKVRFDISIGVAYGSDTALVKKLLLQAVRQNPYVIDYPAPFVRFLDFGGYSLDLKLYFFSRNLMVIEDVKSDIRFTIDSLFREHGVEIPFPQTEVRIVKDS